jgi:hypothetical protein
VDPDFNLLTDGRRLHDLEIELVAGHMLCRRFMQISGVGPVAARKPRRHRELIQINE